METKTETAKSVAETIRENKINALSKCKALIDATLQEYDCSIVGVPVYIPDGSGFKLAVRIELVNN